MTKILSLGEPRCTGGRMVRELRFIDPPAFSLDALCATANAIAVGFSGSIGCPVPVVLGEPVPVDAAGWRKLSAPAWAYAVNDTTTCLIDRRSASNVLAAILGEVPGQRFTPLEVRTLDRFMARVWERAAVGSQTSMSLKRLNDAPVRSWAVDVRANGPVYATLVIGASIPPDPPPGPCLEPSALAGVELELNVQLATGFLTATSLGILAVGETVRMDTKVHDSATLKVADATIAYGQYGEVDGEAGCAGQPAFLVRENVR